MPSVFESQLSLLEREAEGRSGSTAAEWGRTVEQLVLLHTAVYDVLERQIGGGGLTEAHRPLVPLFRRWLHIARRIVTEAGALRTEGQQVDGLDDLLRAMNHAKAAAEDFDQIVRLNERTAREEAGTYRPLAEVLDGLRSKPQPPG